MCELDFDVPGTHEFDVVREGKQGQATETCHAMRLLECQGPAPQRTAQEDACAGVPVRMRVLVVHRGDTPGWAIVQCDSTEEIFFLILACDRILPRSMRLKCPHNLRAEEKHKN